MKIFLLMILQVIQIYFGEWEVVVVVVVVCNDTQLAKSIVNKLPIPTRPGGPTTTSTLDLNDCQRSKTLDNTMVFSSLRNLESHPFRWLLGTMRYYSCQWVHGAFTRSFGFAGRAMYFRRQLPWCTSPHYTMTI